MRTPPESTSPLTRSEAIPAARAAPFPRGVAGFTLTELIVTLIIVGILAVVVLPRMSGTSGIQQRTDYDKVLATIEYARRSAISLRRYVCVSVASTNITLTSDPNPPESTATPFGGTCPFANALTLPVPDPQCGGPTNAACPKTQTITSSAGSFQFDPNGRAAAAVTITVAGFNAITVESETGYVH